MGSLANMQGGNRVSTANGRRLIGGRYGTRELTIAAG